LRPEVTAQYRRQLNHILTLFEDSDQGFQPVVRVPPRVTEDILRNHSSLEPTLILALTKIRPELRC
jgi:hypothetical protein